MMTARAACSKQTLSAPNPKSLNHFLRWLSQDLFSPQPFSPFVSLYTAPTASSTTQRNPFAEQRPKHFMVLAGAGDFLPSPKPLVDNIGSSIERERNGNATVASVEPAVRAAPEDLEAKRSPYIHVMLGGGLGGTFGDMLMHSLDTVKTRQQGDPHMPPKYTTLGRSYYTIFRQEGLVRGLYGGVLPAFLGSFAGTVTFFGTYEWSKRMMIDFGVNPTISYFTAGLVADLAAAPVYVPSEVLKTRLQLQGRYKNPHFHSGYNYRSTYDAARTIIRTEGAGALYYGFRATLWRDLPYSALQFAFYEQEQKLARAWMGSRDIGLPLEIFTGASAGCMAGVLTCPFDVVKTRLQTQHTDPASNPATAKSTNSHREGKLAKSGSLKPVSGTSRLSSSVSRSASASAASATKAAAANTAAPIDTTSMITGLRIIYRTEGVAGWFRGVGPRAVWTGVQSGSMFVLYQTILRFFERNPLVDLDEQ